MERLWVREGRLLQGSKADSLKPLEDHDYLLIAVERGPPREDWRGLPTLTPHEAAFNAPLRDATLDEPTTKLRLSSAFVAFDADLAAEPDLNGPDKDRIRGQVIAELQARVKRKFGGLFTETRSVGDVQRRVDAERFDFLDVGEGGPETARPAAAGARPF